MENLALKLLAFCPILIASQAWAQQMVRILQPVWISLSVEERATIQQRHVVDLRDPAAYALIIDNQGVNESTPGTSSGAALGGAIGSAAYIDRAFKPGNNYSARGQLAVGLLGALIGSTLDKPAVQQYHFRYAVKRYDGEIQYRDNVQSDAFRHPAGICLELATLSPVPQTLCTQTATDVRKNYLALVIPEVMPLRDQAATNASPGELLVPSTPIHVSCKLGNLAPALTTSEKCIAIGGKILRSPC